ncbi:hypothetical protein [Clostridium sp.]
MKFIVLILGVIGIIFPKQVFMFGRGWMYKGKKELGENGSLPRKMLMFGRGWMIKDGNEPSESVKYIGRFIGIILIVLVLLGKV